MKDYEQSDEIEEIAKELITKSHEHLKPIPIAYLLELAKRDKRGNIVSPDTKRMGKNHKIATAAKTPPKYLALCGFEFVIVVKEQFFAFFDPKQKRAVIDHELSHCLLDDNGCYIGDHEIEEFGDIISRYGAWNRNIRRFIEKAQIALPFEETEKKERKNLIQ